MVLTSRLLIVTCSFVTRFLCVLKIIVGGGCCFKDLQMVNIGLRVLARPDASSLPSMYRKLGLDYDERVLPSIMNEVISSLHILLSKLQIWLGP